MFDDLSPEDSFRLQVLLAQNLKAVRLDESALTLHALTDQGEASVPLNPNCKADKYLRRVRELLSGHALGSPGGYPVHLSRWTRHGQMDGLNLGKLLLTGEPEAVVAVVHSPALTNELASYAWWIQPTIENARLMLRREAVARGAMGSVLASFLAEHLPFLQDDHLAIMDTVAVLLYSGALTPEQILGLWRKGRRGNTHFVAFLEMRAGDLPEPLPAHPRLAEVAARISMDDADGGALLTALSAQGQTFLATVVEVLERPETQEVASRALNAVGRYFSAASVPVHVDALPGADAGPAIPLADWLAAAARLRACDDEPLKPVFARSSAIGSLMRRKIEPVVAPLLADMRRLLPDNKTGARRRPFKAL